MKEHTEVFYSSHYICRKATSDCKYQVDCEWKVCNAVGNLGNKTNFYSAAIVNTR
jgi:hypothetical protein